MVTCFPDSPWRAFLAHRASATASARCVWPGQRREEEGSLGGGFKAAHLRANRGLSAQISALVEDVAAYIRVRDIGGNILSHKVPISVPILRCVSSVNSVLFLGERLSSH